MKAQDLTIIFQVDQTPEEVFNAITNVRGWWSEGVKGGTDKLNDEFVYQYRDIHRSTQKLVELVPGKKVVWLVTDSTLTFIEDRSEWNGTKITFEISQKDNRTEVHFTHYGLTDSSECFDACTDGWGQYVGKSLRRLITTGKGQPDTKADATAEKIGSAQ